MWNSPKGITVVRQLAPAGVVAPIVFFSLLVLAGLLRPGYDAVRQFGSELETGSNAWLVHIDFVSVGLLEIAFAGALHVGIKPGRLRYTSLTGPLLVGIAGVGMVLIGVFNGGSIHGRAVKIHSYGLMIAYVILAYRLWQDSRWKSFAPFSVVSAVLASMPWAAMTWLYNDRWVATHVGLVQRSHYALLLGWMGVLAIHLLILRSKTGQDTA
ncbi:MAG: hypothetical protein NVSMB52_05410 [Chloroflexota bacterium]